MDNVRVVIYGVGAIGTCIAKFVLGKKGIEIVGAIDVSPEKVGRDLGDVLGLEEKLGVVVSRDASEVLSKSKPNVTLHATGSFLDKVYPQIVEIVEAGSNVISTCETLAYPYYRYPELSEKLDKLAKELGKAAEKMKNDNANYEVHEFLEPGHGEGNYKFVFRAKKKGGFGFLKAAVRVAKGAMYGGLSGIIRETSYEVQRQMYRATFEPIDRSMRGSEIAALLRRWS
ncbi:MAG: hypothetical protein ACTSXW_04850 [Candidatus Baldrarchaeia archaeon]